MRILAIDPGNELSAYTLYQQRKIYKTGKIKNESLKELISSMQFDVAAIEMIASYGMPVGASVFETCLWIGRFIEVVENLGKRSSLVYRKNIKMHLCNSTKAKDSNVRQAIIDLYPPTGGGKLPQIGIKSKPGPLFGISSDMWASLAVAITFEDTILP